MKPMLICGPQGSGKTTKLRFFLSHYPNSIHLSVDDFIVLAKYNKLSEHEAIGIDDCNENDFKELHRALLSFKENTITVPQLFITSLEEFNWHSLRKDFNLLLL